MSVEFGMLGPVLVLHNGVAQPLSAKQRLLLTVLLIRANEVVPVDSLVFGLWGDRPPVTAVGVVHTYVSQLRKVLEPDRSRGASAQLVVRVDPGYMLVVGPDAVDAARFERLLAAGRSALRDGQPDVAAKNLRDGIGLWRGPALADVADEEVARTDARRLDGLRALAIEERIEADIALGRHHELIGELEALVTEHALRERLWSQLMLCLYRSGRQADALAAFQRLCRTLRDELGLDASPELVRLEHEILVHAPELAWRSPPTRPRPGRATSTMVTSNVLHWSGRRLFVGRTTELESLEAWWLASAEHEALALVLGESGIGKTHLVTEFARRVEERGHAVFYGRALEAGGSSYEPVLGALRQFAMQTSDDVLDTMSATTVGALSRLVPEIAERRPELAARADGWEDVDRSWLLTAVSECFDRLSAEPMLMVLDDLQWADRPALLLLSRLLVPGKPLRVLATCRHPGGLTGSQLADLLAEFRRDGRSVRRIELTGMNDAEVADLVTTIAPDATSVDGQELATALHRRTKGHPLFVRECVLQLQSTWTGEELPRGHDLERLGVPDGAPWGSLASVWRNCRRPRARFCGLVRSSGPSSTSTSSPQ